jgi:hypothetical protein
MEIKTRNKTASGKRLAERYLESMSFEGFAAHDRVLECRRAVALARHFRDAEGLSVAQIAERLGRSPAMVKAYFYDPSDANKGPSWERQATAGGRELRRHLAPAAPRGEIYPWRTVFCAWAGCPVRSEGVGF